MDALNFYKPGWQDGDREWMLTEMAFSQSTKLTWVIDGNTSWVLLLSKKNAGILTKSSFSIFTMDLPCALRAFKRYLLTEAGQRKYGNELSERFDWDFYQMDLPGDGRTKEY